MAKIYLRFLLIGSLFFSVERLFAADFWTSVSDYVSQTDAVKQADQTVAAKEGLRVRHLFFSNPSLVFNSNDDGATYQYGVSLPVGLPGKAIALYGVDDAEVKAARIDRHRIRQDMTLKVAEDILNCLENKERVEMMAQSLRDAQEQYSFLQDQYARGFTSHTEFILAEIQLNQFQFENDLLKSKSIEFCEQAGRVYGISDMARMPEYSLPEIRSWDFGEGTLEQKEIKADTLILEAKKKTLYWEQLPDLNLNFLRNNYRILSASPYQSEPRAWTNSFGVAITFPLLWPFDENLEIKQKRAQYLTQLEDQKRNARNAATDMRQMQTEFVKSTKRLEVIVKKEFPLAEKLKSYSLQNFKNGKISFAELVLARKTVLDVHLQKVELNSKLIKLAIRCGEACYGLEGKQ